MNTNPAENELTTMLTREADRYTAGHGNDVTMETVLARAGEIRRGRRMRATMVMAAVVLAVAVPVGITVLNGDHGPNRETPSPALPVNLDPIRLDGLKAGDKPGIAWYADGVLHDGDSAITVPGKPEVNSVARLSEGYLVTVQGEGGLETRYVGQDPVDDLLWPNSGSGVAVSPGRTVGAFVEPDGTVLAVEAGGARFFEVGKLPADGGYVVAGITGENCSGRSEDGCTIFVADRGAEPTGWLVSPNQAPEKVAGLRGLNAVSKDGTLAQQVSATDDGSCSRLATPAFAELWKTCEAQLKAFSPDGAKVLGPQAYGDGLGDGELYVFDRDNGKQLLHRVTADGVTLRSMVWEDETHVLAVVSSGLRFAVIRFGLDGSRELALPVVTGTDDLTPPYLLDGR